MTPLAQRIAIAEACGAMWTTTREGYGFPVHILVPENYTPPNSWDDSPGMTPKPEPRLVHSSVSDYLNSLDAMHEAEKVLTPMNVPDYVEWLREIESSSDDFSDLVHAEAKKKAEAFLRTLNLWTE